MAVANPNPEKSLQSVIEGIALLLVLLGVLLIIISFVRSAPVAENTNTVDVQVTNTAAMFSFVREEDGFAVVVPGNSFAPRVDKTQDSTYGVSTFRFSTSDGEPVSVSVYPAGITPGDNTPDDAADVTIGGTHGKQYTVEQTGGSITVTLLEHGGNAYRISGSGENLTTILSHFLFTQ